MSRCKLLLSDHTLCPWALIARSFKQGPTDSSCPVEAEADDWRVRIDLSTYAGFLLWYAPVLHASPVHGRPPCCSVVYRSSASSPPSAEHSIIRLVEITSPSAIFLSPFEQPGQACWTEQDEDFAAELAESRRRALGQDLKNAPGHDTIREGKELHECWVIGSKRIKSGKEREVIHPRLLDPKTRIAGRARRNRPAEPTRPDDSTEAPTDDSDQEFEIVLQREVDQQGRRGGREVFHRIS